MHRLFRVCFVGKVDQQGPQFTLSQRVRIQIEYFEEDRVLKIVGHEANQFGPLGRQASRDETWAVAEIAGGRTPRSSWPRPICLSSYTAENFRLWSRDSEIGVGARQQQSVEFGRSVRSQGKHKRIGHVGEMSRDD